jgi:hypothetical protein
MGCVADQRHAFYGRPMLLLRKSMERTDHRRCLTISNERNQFLGPALKLMRNTAADNLGVARRYLIDPPLRILECEVRARRESSHGERPIEGGYREFSYVRKTAVGPKATAHTMPHSVAAHGMTFS